MSEANVTEITGAELLSNEQINQRLDDLGRQLAEALKAKQAADGNVRAIQGAIQEAEMWAAVIRRAKAEGVINGTDRKENG